jgi:hypothetical protein
LTNDHTPAEARPPARYHAKVITFVCGVRRLGALPNPISGGSTTAPIPAADPSAAPRNIASPGPGEPDADQRVVQRVCQQVARERKPLQLAL